MSQHREISTDTVIDYLGYLKETWLVFQVENVCAKLAEKESNKKYYFVDNGILNLFLIDPVTSLLENLVAIRLRQLYGDDLYFYQQGIEVDFYVMDIQLALQVSYSLSDPETRNRGCWSAKSQEHSATAESGEHSAKSKAQKSKVAMKLQLR